MRSKRNGGTSHRFRSAAARGFALHTTNPGSFWSVLVPQVTQNDEAVKHAVVALGSAFHMHDRRLEEFVITQYNKTIRSLQRHMASASPEGTEITFVCCLMFTFLETIRSRSDAALVHFAHGRRIFDTLPASARCYLHVPPSFGGPPRESEQQRQRECGPIVRHISKAEWRQLLAFFTELEFRSHMSGDAGSSSSRAGLRPRLVHGGVVAELPEAVAAFGGEYEDEGYETLDGCHNKLFAWGLRVFVRVVETLPHNGEAAFWADPEQRRLHAAPRRARPPRPPPPPLAPRSVAAEAAAAGPGRPGPSGACLHGRGMFFILVCMPHNYTRRKVMTRFDTMFREFMDMNEELAGLLLDSSSDSRTGPGENNKRQHVSSAATVRKEKEAEDELKLPAITFDNGVLVALHVVLYGTGSGDLKRRAMRVLCRLGNRRKGMYDAAGILRVFAGIGAKGEDGRDYEEDPLLDELVGPYLTSLGGPPGLKRRLVPVKLAGGKGTRGDSDERG
ncbi:hypothetical protein DL769_004103 [Monosporascus sp. CRB-8-3]|nr:hypothetical protein DL769_004103 [Monosporascus sp. CRB-8-3]